MTNEVPTPYTTALAKGRTHAPRHRCSCIDGVPRPWTNALEVRCAAAGTLPVAAVSRGNAAPPKPYSLAIAARRAAEGR